MSSNTKSIKTNTTAKLKTIMISSAVGMVITSITLVIIAFFMTRIDFPQKSIYPLSVISSAIGLFSAGFLSTKILKCDGLLNGLLCGIIIYTFSFMCELAIFNREISILALYKFIIYIVTAMIGGVVAVNFTKNSVKIKKYR